jgi:hypothetical protein
MKEFSHFSILDTDPAHLTLLDLFIPVIFGEDCSIWISSARNFLCFAVTPAHLGSPILLRTRLKCVTFLWSEMLSSTPMKILPRPFVTIQNVPHLYLMGLSDKVVAPFWKKLYHFPAVCRCSFNRAVMTTGSHNVGHVSDVVNYVSLNTPRS